MNNLCILYNHLENQNLSRYKSLHVPGTVDNSKRQQASGISDNIHRNSDALPQS